MSDYKGKRVLVVGGATGMGAAAAQKAAALGAEVTVLDVAEVKFPVKAFLPIDLRDKDDVDAVIGKLERPIDVIFSCAGVADGARGLLPINFLSQRRLIEGLLAKDALPRGSAIGMISSTAGNGWRESVPQIKEFFAIPDWEGQTKWIAANKTDNGLTNVDGYMFSKRCVCAYVAARAFSLLSKGIRINAILPGPTDTPLARANADVWLAYAADYRAAAGVKHLQPEEMAEALIFLCSPAASGITGENVVVDQGYTASQIMGSFPG
jgi:NAD(P)-dependent dehydrogenase (short-subunit alcohol dehydrogenase family)